MRSHTSAPSAAMPAPSRPTSTCTCASTLERSSPVTTAPSPASARATSRCILSGCTRRSNSTAAFARKSTRMSRTSSSTSGTCMTLRTRRSKRPWMSSA
ncbi:hypothetical protein LEMLEM_LOCUS11047 [Lemmus lemmus]